ncbi:(+)-neomenthol dehydrogenase [Triticum urartu]|uniref:(+)-neomenthol dehydrogenase n=1 Tax=Triticum urartu TaxID=4572 RepID=M7YML9_TRIUA|nr:(+)-neomenthol dehydrogenase [Triticum urartu]
MADGAMAVRAWWTGETVAVVTGANRGIGHALAARLAEQGLSVVNNAGVSFNEIDTNSVEHAETVLKTNFYGAKMLIEALLPLFRRSSGTSRILNLSSQLGLLNKVRDPSLRSMLLDEGRLTEQQVEAMASRFLAQGTGRKRPRYSCPDLNDDAVEELIDRCDVITSASMAGYC